MAGPFPAAARVDSSPLAAPPAAPAESAPAAEQSALLPFAPAAPNPAIPDSYEQIGETPSLRLYVDRSNSKLIVEDKRSGKLWSSNPLTPLSDQKSLLDDALFLLNYTNARRQMTNLASSASNQPNLSFQNLQNGVRVVYDIQALKLKITIDYVIKEDPKPDGSGTTPYLEVTVPDDGIAETGDCTIATSTTCFMITSLELLPLLGAAPVGDQGYLVIPDESGAIVNFKPEYPQYRQRYSAQIYGTDAASQAFVGFGGGGTDRYRMYFGRPRMPLFGLKDADSAYALIATKGEFQANINAYLAGYITNANRGSVEFLYRRQASIPRRRTLFVNRIEDNRMPGDRQVRYTFLTGADANYAGVAKAYRDYLMKDKGVQRLPKETPRPLIDFFMGITRRTSFREDFVDMTTFDQGIEMIQQFLDKGIKDFDVNLIGWNDDGYRGRWPRRYPAESTLGGDAGLRRIIDFAHKTGVRIYLQDEYVQAYTFSSGGIFGQIPFVRNLWPNWSYGFNSRWDTIRGVNKLPVFGGTAGVDLYLLNPVIARTRYFDRDIPKTKSFGADGLELNQFGSRVYSDTNERYPLSREQVAQEWMKIADSSKQQLGNVMVQGGNSYVLGHTDSIYDAPTNSLDAFGDVEVPLYHIATHGLVTTHTNAVNLRNDPKTEFLRQIEWGMQPVYELTHQPSADLIRTNQQIYSSQITDWLDPAAKEYAQMRDEFGYLNSQFITNHEILANRVTRVTYEDGSQMLVNSNPQPYDGPEGHVDAYGYVLRKGSSK
jgi:hypothetical protein